MVSNNIESNLIRRAKRGDPQALDELFVSEQNYLFNLMYQLSGDVATAEDLVQETFLRAYQKLSSFRLKSRFRTWLTRVAINIFLQSKRKKPELYILNLGEIKVPSQDDCPERIVIKREIQWCIHHTLHHHVPEKFRILLILRELQGFSYKDIAKILRTSVPDVKIRLYRARNFLKEIFTHPQSPCHGFVKEYRCVCDGILEIEREMEKE
jgi:RNA polymerase sigma-70 factor (ECF subfamily)